MTGKTICDRCGAEWDPAPVGVIHKCQCGYIMSRSTIHTAATGSGDFSIGGNLWPGLSKLIEECGEVLQVGGKLMGSEGRTDHWSGDLSTMLVEEIGDLRAAIRFFEMKNSLDAEAIKRREETKLLTFLAWHTDMQAARQCDRTAR